MNPELVVAIPLICPACRTRSADAWEMYSVDPSGSDHLECQGCGHRYPIIDGIPVVSPNLGALMRKDGFAVVEGLIAPEIAASLAESGSDGDAWARLLESISTWATAHWGDRVASLHDDAAHGFAALTALVAERANEPVARAIDLGCGFGRGTLELACGAEVAVGLDMGLAGLRRGNRAVLGEGFRYALRMSGRHYRPVTVQAADPVKNVLFVAGDAMDPPLPPGAFERVMALNLLDNVRSPRELLRVMDGLCAPMGELILATPFAWTSDVTDDDQRLGGLDPTAALRTILESGEGLTASYTIADEREVPWTLRRDARSRISYDVYWIRAQKGLS